MNSHRGYLHLFLIDWRDDLDKDTILEETTNDLTTRNIYLAFTILNPVLPVSFIERSVRPKHLSVTLSLIVYEIAFVEVTTRKI